MLYSVHTSRPLLYEYDFASDPSSDTVNKENLPFFISPVIKNNIVAALCILVGIYEYPICTLDYGMDPDPDPDPTLFGTCFQDGNKNCFFFLLSLFAYFLL